MTRDEILTNVRKLSETLKRPIPVYKYKRTRIVQEEVVEAYKTPVPSGIRLPNGKNKQVEKDDWVIIHQDGSQSTYTNDEFFKVFEKITLGETFKEPLTEIITGGSNESLTPNK